AYVAQNSTWVVASIGMTITLCHMKVWTYHILLTARERSSTRLVRELMSSNVLIIFMNYSFALGRNNGR
ncbi:hypothetical protein ACJX0J_017253, partial [Zea mays]